MNYEKYVNFYETMKELVKQYESDYDDLRFEDTVVAYVNRVEIEEIFDYSIKYDTQKIKETKNVVDFITLYAYSDTVKNYLRQLSLEKIENVWKEVKLIIEEREQEANESEK